MSKPMATTSKQLLRSLFVSVYLIALSVCDGGAAASSFSEPLELRSYLNENISLEHAARHIALTSRIVKETVEAELRNTGSKPVGTFHLLIPQGGSPHSSHLVGSVAAANITIETDKLVKAAFVDGEALDDDGYRYRVYAVTPSKPIAAAAKLSFSLTVHYGRAYKPKPASIKMRVSEYVTQCAASMQLCMYLPACLPARPPARSPLSPPSIHLAN
eukprot:GHVU01235446.1.p1 GENE.GHVU01235446.1~~GHVU01235446.1.p1  ORF type:complete len:216 (-),score=26.27 GHVU01235446.1:215-862(-)